MNEPSITRCEPGRRTPKDQIRIRERQMSPVTLTTSVRGISGQTMLSRAQREDEAAIMAVALNQPHWRGVPELGSVAQYDMNYLPSPLGKFCREHHENGDGSPMSYRTSTAFLRYRAGMEYAMVVNDARIAEGLKGAQRGDSGDPQAPDDEKLQARKELCRKRLREAKDVIVTVDRDALEFVNILCVEERPILNFSHAMIVVQALYQLSLNFGIEKPGYHEEVR
jgi:hypothetical protein